jgi:hypothetical protein
MTNAEAWERFADSALYMWGNAFPDGSVEYRCGRYMNIECGDWDGRGPSPEAAIAAAFGETLEDDAQ